MTLEAKFKKLISQEAFPEAHNYQELHGFLTAKNSGPEIREKFNPYALSLFGEQISELSTFKDELTLIEEIDDFIVKELLSGEPIQLPCTLTLGSQGQPKESLSDWLFGFFEYHFLDEQSWYNKDEEITAELLVPLIALFSGIETEELAGIREDKKILQNLSFQIPKAIQDLYLFYRV